MAELLIVSSLMSRLRTVLSYRPRNWLFSLLAVIVLAGAVTAATPKFAIQKQLCSGNALSMADPAACSPISDVPQGAVSYYMITLTNPWGEPVQSVNVTDQIPSDFTPAIGGVFCRDENNLPVAWAPSNSATMLLTVQLAPGQTVHCFIAGTMTGVSGQTGANTVKNIASGTNGAGYSNLDDVKSTVFASSPLGADLAVAKTASPNSVNLSAGPQTVTYTITITNNGPNPVDVADWFKLHDSFALLPNSVPLNATIVGASSVASPGSSPLDPAGPQINGQYNNFVGTIGQHNVFDWGFGSGTGAGHIAVGGVITVTITVQLSAVHQIDCVVDPSANGLRNTVFFTLTNPANGTALNDNNIANNTAGANVTAIMPYSQISPDCAKGQLKIDKIQLLPPPASQVAWNSQVDYQITIKNVSVPAQNITIKRHDLQDWVEEGINTPPFGRNHIKTDCDQTLSSTGLCGPFSAGFTINPPHNYTYYTEVDQAWDNNPVFTLPYGKTIVFKTSFVYSEPDCETVPNTPTRPIINHIRATYKASPFGSPNGTPAVIQTQSAKAVTLMEKTPPCKFKVTKVRTSPSGPLHFGIQQNYTVTFQNQGPDRKIGTVMDAVRITIPNYASILPFASSWNCTGVTTVSGSQPNGIVSFVGSPAQGSPAALINLASNTFFPSGGTLTCNVGITVGRPPLKDKFCTTDDAYFENVALMDVTAPFNPNIFWPPSGTYNTASLLNPLPQIRNWASVRTMLPKCWDAQINKTASVNGLPAGTAPWTYAGNPNPVNYAITVSNLAQSTLGLNNTAAPGWIVQDKFESGGPYASGNQTFNSSTVCMPNSPLWCWPTAPQGQISIKKLKPYGQVGSQGAWNLQLPGSFVQQGKDILNCAWILPQNAQAGPDWYNNQVLSPIPTHTCTENTAVPSHACPPDSPLVACVKVPVIEVTKISVRKQIIDQTGANVTAASGYAITVGCTPYAVPSYAGGSMTLNTNASGTSAYQSVYPVPMSGTCTVTEVGSPIPPAISAKCGGAANVLEAVSYTPLPSPLNSVDNQVTVTNTYSCKPVDGRGQLEVIKQLNTIQHPVLFPATNWLINTNCTPAGTASSLTLTTPASGNAQITTSGMVYAPIGANCTVSEQTPSNTLIPSWFKASCANQNGIAVWDAPKYTVNGGSASTTAPSVPITSGVQTVTVINGWHCQPNGGQLEVIKQLNTIQTAVQFPARNWLINTSCTPAATASSLTLTTPASGNAQITTSGMVNAPIGSNCTISEQLPANSLIPSTFQASCTNQNATAVWNTPQYTLNNGAASTNAPSVPITSGVQTVTVINGWHCQPNSTNGGSTTVQLVKTVQGPPPIPGALPPPSISATYVFNSNCSVPSTPTTLTYVGTGGQVVTVPTGTACNFVEQPPAMPTAATTYCQGLNGYLAVWDTTTWSIPQPMTATGSMQYLLVTNKWKCIPPPVVKKKKTGFHFNVGIGLPGIGSGGKKNDKPADNGPPRP